MSAPRIPPPCFRPARLLGMRLVDMRCGTYSGVSDDGLFTVDLIDHYDGSYSATFREVRAWAHPVSVDDRLAHVSRVEWDALEPAIRRCLSRGIEVRRAAMNGIDCNRKEGA